MKKIFSIFIYNTIFLFLIITITFFIIKLIPGDPFLIETESSDQIISNLMQKHNLDKPLIQQYFTYIYNISHFNFGVSIRMPDTKVADIILNHFPISLDLGIKSLVLSIVTATLLAIFTNRLNNIIIIFGICTPSFIIAFLLQIFAIYFKKLTSIHISIHGYDTISNQILPIIALSMLNISKISSLLTRGLQLEYSKDYVLLAKTKGLSDFKIKMKHCLKNSVIPIISVLAPSIANIITGSFIIESMFGIPGIGKYYIESINSRDYSVILGLTLFYSIILIFILFITDIIVLALDPKRRIKGDDINEKIF